MCHKIPENVVKEAKKMDGDNPLDPILGGIAHSLERRRLLLARLRAVGRDLENLATETVLQPPISRGQQLLAALQASRTRNGANQASNPPPVRGQQVLVELRLIQAATRRLRASTNPPAGTTTVDTVDDPHIVRGEQILASLRAARSGNASPPVASTSPIENAGLATPAIPRGRPAVLQMLGITPVDQL